MELIYSVFHIQAVRTALRMLEGGHNVRDAAAVCGPDVLNQIFKWKVLCYFFFKQNSRDYLFLFSMSYRMIFFHCFFSLNMR